MSSIERVRLARGVELTAFLDDKSLPMIIEGGALHLPAVKRFSPSYLTDKLGDIEIQWKASSSHKHPDFGVPGGELAKMFAREGGTFAEFIRQITSGSAAERSRRLFTGDEQFLVRRRDGETTIDPALRPLLDDADVMTLVRPDRLYTAWAWFSAAGVRTWLHYDNNGCHNLNAQLTGEKDCVMFSPDDLRHAYPFLLGEGNPATNCSRIDIEDVNEERFPTFSSAPCWTGTVSAGDLLFIPAWWWHSFHHRGEFNSNVNVWWKPGHEVANATSRRQALLDLVTRAALSPRLRPGSSEADLLRQLDEAAISAPL